MSLRTQYEFTLPRGYVDSHGVVHRTGVMRLATARDELAPLRDPTITGPDDPRLTILVLTRVVEKLGDVELISSAVIEGLFAVDLAFLQDFYGVINFGSQDEYDALLQAQAASPLLGEPRATPVAAPGIEPDAETSAAPIVDAGDPGAESPEATSLRPLRAAVEELPRRTS